MMIRPSEPNRSPDTSPVVFRVSASERPTSAPSPTPTIAVSTEARSTHDPRSETIACQLTEIPATSAIASARFEIFPSSVGVVGVAGADQQADRQRSEDEQQKVAEDRAGADRRAADHRTGPQRNRDEVHQLQDHDDRHREREIGAACELRGLQTRGAGGADRGERQADDRVWGDRQSLPDAVGRRRNQNRVDDDHQHDQPNAPQRRHQFGDPVAHPQRQHGGGDRHHHTSVEQQIQELVGRHRVGSWRSGSLIVAGLLSITPNR
jgi:hypothetical protein